MVHPDRTGEVERFLAGYLAVRHAEGRAHDDPAWYRALPATDPDDPMSEQWRMRGVSWRHLVRRVIEPNEAEVRRPLRVLDVGAGTGWMSRQLRSRGHEPISIDVNVDAYDGLGAAHHLDPDWPVVQAHFDHLPLADGQADLCVFNASLPYTADLTTTLGEAMRVLRPGGTVVVMDSPVYGREIDGRRMAAERHADFERRFGTRSDALSAIEFLTSDRLRGAGEMLDLAWSSTTPWYGLLWASRPFVARLRRRRRPGRFVVLSAQRRSSSIMK